MAQLGSYDQTAAPAEDWTPLPADTYPAYVEESDVKANKKQNGERLNLKWRVVAGKHQGRVFWQGINIRHVNAKAQEIGQRELASLRAATGVTNAQDSQEFHGIVCSVKLGIQPAGTGDDGVYRDARNEVKAVSAAPAQGAAPTQPATQRPAPTQPAPQRQYVAPQQQPAPAANGKPPWSQPR